MKYRSDGLRWRDIHVHTKFHKDRFRSSKVVREGGIHTQTHTQTVM
jgi:hypothetical protein